MKRPLTTLSKLCETRKSADKETSYRRVTTFGPINEIKTHAKDALNDTLMSSPVSPLPNTSRHVTLDIDGCSIRVGFVIFTRTRARNQDNDYPFVNVDKSLCTKLPSCSMKTHSNYMDCDVATSITECSQIHQRNWSWIIEADLETQRQYRQTRKLFLTALSIWFRLTVWTRSYVSNYKQVSTPS